MVFKDYALPGDQMALSFDTAATKISTVKVDTYLDDPKDVVTLAVQFASLPDSTNYVQQTVLDATAKKLVVTTTNSDYKALGAQ
jgi:predicted dinucleotide-binding enzyme